MIELPNNSYTMTELPDFVSVGNYSSIGSGVIFHSREQEHQYSINKKCVYTTHWDQPQETGRISIRHDVWIGDGVRILPDTIIGIGVIVGAGAVVKGPVTDFSVIVGNPAQIAYWRFTDKQIEALYRIKWWEWPNVTEEQVEEMKDIDSFIEKYDKK